MASSHLTGPARRIGILAGGGSLPLEIADSVAARNVPVFLVGLDGEVDRSFAPRRHVILKWGEIGRIIATLRAEGITDLVIVGFVRRPDVLRTRKDLGFYMALPSVLGIMASGGDDGVLRAVIRFLETKGFRVVGPQAVAPEIVVHEGPLGREAPTPADHEDILKGYELVRRLAAFDIGQGVVVSNGRVEAIEGADGTDAMLERVARSRRAAGVTGVTSSRGVLVKRPKPGQEMRVDLPTIGPETVRRAVEAGLGGIAVLPGQALAAERAELIRLADGARLFVAGIEDAESPEEPHVKGRWRAHAGAGVRFDLTRRMPSRRQEDDARKGAAITAALARDGVGRGVVVVNGHVLAVEAGEGISAMLARAAGLRQWGKGLFKKRKGALVIADPARIDGSLVAAAAAAQLSGIAYVGVRDAVTPATVAAATAAKLWVMALSSVDGA